MKPAKRLESRFKNNGISENTDSTLTTKPRVKNAAAAGRLMMGLQREVRQFKAAKKVLLVLIFLMSASRLQP